MRFLAVIALCLAAAVLAAGGDADRHADRVQRRAHAGHRRAYLSAARSGRCRERSGTSRRSPGLQPVFLLRGDSPLGEIVLQSLKTVVQFEIPAELRLLNVAALKTHPVGSETVNGIATTKYAIDKSIPEGHAEGTLWLSRDGIPMRLAGTFTNAKGKVSTVRWELSGVKTGPLPATLFEPPAGLSKLPPEAIAPLLGLKLKGTRDR